MVDMVRAVRAAVGLDATLAMDCHWKFNVNDAIRLARALEPFDLAWLEDPTPPLNMAAQREVARATKTPICTGENLYRLEGFRELIDSQAARIVAPDIPKMGGLMEFKKVADLAAASYIPMAPHNVSSPVATVAAAEVCAAIPNFLVLEYHAHEVDWWADLVDGEPPIRDGHVRLNSRPGHGLTLNEDVARAHLRKGHSYFGETP
jgi:L-alanine-DL-glutamate epimerase-like enolase superfamily enzyme